MTAFQKLGVSFLSAFVAEILCVLMMLSGGAFFGPIAFVGVALLWPSGFISNFLFGNWEGEFVVSLFLAFVQFFGVSWWIISMVCRRRGAVRIL